MPQKGERQDLGVRFWSKVDRSAGPDGCWPYTGAKFLPQEYGAFWLDGRQQRAHRVAYLLAHGVDPGSLMVRHRCDFQPCCNPDHLELGTAADNTRDAVERGQHPRGERSGNSKLTAPQVLEIRAARLKRCACSGERCARTCASRRVPLRALAARYGVTMTEISKVARRAAWAQVG